MQLNIRYIQPIYETKEVKELSTLKVRYQLNFSPWDGNACFFLGALEPEVFNFVKDSQYVNCELIEVYGEFPYRIDSYELNQKLPIKWVVPYMGNIGNSRYAVFKHLKKRKIPVNIWYFSKNNKKVLLDLAKEAP